MFTLAELASPGKSTLLARIAQQHPTFLLCAPTGKAAAVLRSKTSLPASTIHAALLKLVGRGTDSTGRLRLEFTAKHDPGALVGNVLLVDEASMIPADLGRAMLDSGAKIIAAIDPGQLPPVSGPAWLRPPFGRTLRQIHRQAEDSGIIRQAHAVRAGGLYTRGRPDFDCDGAGDDRDLLGADIVLCWKNDTRHTLNQRIRKLHKFSGAPQAGEPVIILNNAPRYRIFNGETYTLARPFDRRWNVLTIMRNGRAIEIPRCKYVKGGEASEQHGVVHFDLAYAITVHRSQGSEWPRVLLVDEKALEIS